MKSYFSFSFNWFDWFLVLGTTIVSALSMLMGDGWDTIGFVVAVTGVLNLVLCAKGNIINYAFGIIYNAIYVYIAFHSKLYADSALYLCYYLPMQFVGWYNWKKNQNAESGTVNVRHITSKMGIVFSISAAVLIPIFSCILSLPFIADSQPWLDSATTVVSLIAMYMMVKAIAEQWYIWLALDLLQVVKWTVATIDGEEHAALTLVMFVFFVANAVYGLILWNRLASSGKSSE
ncbi:MAG: nicotinamide mononucleotide transporter [Bacteroidales bacterium]|nr:nicotinamide mononucleotide transporter [Candidatus Cacconaster caballi]